MPRTRTVNFLPVDRINKLIAVAPNPGVFDTIDRVAGKARRAGEDHRRRASRTMSIASNMAGADCLALGARPAVRISAEHGGYGGGDRPATQATARQVTAAAIWRRLWRRLWRRIRRRLSAATVRRLSAAEDTVAAAESTGIAGGYGNANSFQLGFGGPAPAARLRRRSFGGQQAYGYSRVRRIFRRRPRRQLRSAPPDRPSAQPARPEPAPCQRHPGAAKYAPSRRASSPIRWITRC